MPASLWSHIVTELEGLLSEQDLNMYIRPLHVVDLSDELRLLAPNRYAVEGIEHTCLDIIRTRAETAGKTVLLTVGSTSSGNGAVDHQAPPLNGTGASPPPIGSRLNKDFTFGTFVQGKSNQLARAAAIQVSQNPGEAYNPLFICGGVGLGKTHLMHGVGNVIETERKKARVAYVRSERFVHDMVTALQHNRISEFKELYRSLDALLIDDIQFLAGKERSQEEFFHTFNALLEAGAQIVLTCDRYPKEVDGLEERLKSRFGQGLTVAIDPPELETSVAILKSKAEAANIELPDEVAFLVARSLRSNVRELEGALRRITATAELTGQDITLEFAKLALRDLLVVSERLISLESIQRTVGEYFNIRISELLSKRRSRSIARPRQLAMALAKELTNHSYPEIGDAFGGRDHTTVLHACRKIAELRKTDQRVHEDHKNLLRILTQ